MTEIIRVKKCVYIIKRLNILLTRANNFQLTVKNALCTLKLLQFIRNTNVCNATSNSLCSSELLRTLVMVKLVSFAFLVTELPAYAIKFCIIYAATSQAIFCKKVAQNILDEDINAHKIPYAVKTCSNKELIMNGIKWNVNVVLTKSIPSQSS